MLESKKMKPNYTKIVKLKNKKIEQINDKIQANDSVTTAELNKIWDYFLKSQA